MSERMTTADEIVARCLARRLPVPEREYKFAAPVRLWAFDLAWVDAKIALEIEGGAFAGKPCPECGQRPSGRHNRGAGFRKDREKYGEAFCRGWRVLTVMPEQVKSGLVMDWLQRVLTRVK